MYVETTSAQRRRCGQPRRLLTVAIIAGALAVGGIASAQSPGPDGTINGCVNKTSRALRVLDPYAGQTCTAQEVALPWKSGTTGKVADADKLDGKDSSAYLNGLQRVTTASARNSDSPKSAQAVCPPGKQVIGTGADLDGAWKGVPPNSYATVVVSSIVPSYPGTTPASVRAFAYELNPTNDAWLVRATALCATVTP